MLLFTLVKSSFNMYEAWKRKLSTEWDIYNMFSRKPTYCYDTALWSKPVFWNPCIEDMMAHTDTLIPSFTTLALICPEVDTLRINLCEVSSCSPSLSDDSSPASPVWKKTQLVKMRARYWPTDRATTSGGFYHQNVLTYLTCKPCVTWD